MEKKNNRPEKHKKTQLEKEVMAKPLEILSMENISTDPNGSWTGVPLNPFDVPVQDADDL